MSTAEDWGHVHFLWLWGCGTLCCNQEYCPYQQPQHMVAGYSVSSVPEDVVSTTAPSRSHAEGSNTVGERGDGHNRRRCAN